MGALFEIGRMGYVEQCGVLLAIATVKREVE
jgi:hypothetical protein